jgi:ABC-type transporter Mla MlaB component
MIQGQSIMSAFEHLLVSNSGRTRFELTGSQDVRVVGELHRNLIELLALSEPLCLDCTRIDAIDTAALQLILAAKREAAEKLEIVAESDSEAGLWFRMAGVLEKLQPEYLAQK